MAPPEQRPPTILSRLQRRLLAICVGLAVFLVANTLYLLGVRALEGGSDGGAPGLPVVLQTMVLSHTGVGVVLVLLTLLFAGMHLTRVWRLRSTASVASGVVAVVASLLLLGTGTFILTAAASQANRWAWWLHVVAAAALPTAYVLHRRFGSHPIGGPAGRRFTLAAVGGVVLLGGIHAFEAGGAPARGPSPGPAMASSVDGATSEDGPASASDDPGASPAFTPAGLPSTAHPFFPSSATTRTGELAEVRALIPEASTRTGERALAATVSEEATSRGFASGPAIGAETCVRCHADIVEQWRTSAHRFSSLNNPFYEASLRGLRDGREGDNAWLARHVADRGGDPVEPGRVKSRWCAGCHDPALLFTGALDDSLDRSSPRAQAGLTCMACHAIERIHDVTGNGNYTLNDAAEDPYVFSGAAPGTVGAFLHDAALRARPDTHRRLLAKPVFETSVFCATCHKVSLPEAVNGYRWLRGQNEYDAWHNSGVARNAARTFYLPAAARECQDCHMPREPAPLGDLAAQNGTVRSHRFLGANTALPFLRGDSQTIRLKEEFLREGKLRVDLFALRTRTGGDEEERVVMALDEAEPAVELGGRIGVEVVVRNLGVGHTFPGGTNDSNQAWLEFTVLDGEGGVVWRSGEIGDDGYVDAEAHRYGAVFVDSAGGAVLERNVQDIRAPAAVHVIGPGTADVAHYELRLPPDLAGDAVTLRARLLWRKFNRAFTEFAWSTAPEGFVGFPEVPDLPVTEIASDEVTLPVGLPASGGSAATTDAPDGVGAVNAAAGADDGSAGSAPAPLWMRFNDYGIALLLEGNTRLAAPAFERVAELAPERIDGPLNLARTALAAGNLEDAYRHLEAAERVETGNARAAWVWGLVLQEDGRWDEAELAYGRVLEVFPEDRAAWRNLGQTRFLSGDQAGALEALDAALAIDPEDRIAHYFRMLSLRVVGRESDAAAAQAAFEYYGIDESAQRLTRELRSADPGVNLMAQPIHTHRPPGEM